MRSDFARSTFAVLLGLAIIVPLINYYRVFPVSTLYSEVFAGILFLGAAASGAALFAGRPRVHGSLMVFVLGLLAILAFHVASGYYEYALSWVTWAAYLLVFFLAACVGQWAAQDGQLRLLLVERLTHALAIAALFNVFAQAAQVSGFAEQIQPFVMVPGGASRATYKCSPSGNVAQLNHANVLAWLGICSLVYLTAAKRVRVFTGSTGIALLLVSAALTSARMAWLMALAVAVLMVNGRQSMRVSTSRAVTAASLLVVGLLAATIAKKALVGEGCPTSIERAIGAGGTLDYWVRIELMRQSLMVWWSEPVLGVGVGKFLATAFALEPNLDVEHVLDFFPHNTLLEMLLSFGAIGGGLVLACTGYWLLRVWRQRSQSLEQWPMLAGLAVLTIHAMLEMPLWYLYYLIPFGLMLGVALGPATAADWSVRLPSRALVFAGLIVGVPALSFAVLDHAKAERAIWLGEIAREAEFASGAAVERLAELTAELKIFRFTAERELLRFGQLDAANLKGLDAANRRLMNNMPDPLAVSRQILIETGRGRLDEAGDLMRRLMAFYPRHYEALVDEMRKKAGERPDEFGSLLPVLEETLKHRPQPRSKS